MTRKNSLALTAEDVEKHNAKVRAQRIVFQPTSTALKEDLKRYKYGGGAQGGKTAAQEAAMAEFTRKNPGATVARFRHGECIIEKGIANACSIAGVDTELLSLGVPMHLLPAPMPAIPGATRTRMNKLESEWAMILEARKRAGEIVWYQFEGLRLRLADGAYFTPDFPVLNASGQLEFQETKGFWREAAKLRIKVAACMYPFWKFYAIKKKRKKDGGGWDIEGF